MALSKRHGINPKTVAKWKRRTSASEQRVQHVLVDRHIEPSRRARQLIPRPTRAARAALQKA